MKKILLLLLLLVTAANADYEIIVNSPADVDSMYAVLNAVASIFHSNNYLDLLRLMFLLGGFVSFYSWVIGTFSHGEAHSGGANFVKFNIGAVALLTLVFSAQTTLWVKSEHFPKYYDNNNTTTMGVAVSNIPYVAAYGIYFLNSFGHGLTKMYQTAMTPVGEYSLADGGYASALRDDFQLLSMKLSNSDATLGTAMGTMISQCVFIPFSAQYDGAKRIEQIRKSSDIEQTIDNWYKNGVKVGGIKASNYEAKYQGQIWKCGDLWKNIKNTMLPQFNQKAGKYLKNLDSRDLEMITGLKNVPKSNFDQIALQAGIVNSVLNNKDIGAGVAYASGKTQAEFVQQNVGAGYYMSRMLPIMQTLFQAIIYALFPAIVALALLPGGWLILKNYIKTAVWIELWGVIAAILNFFILKYGEHTIAGNITAYSASKMLTETSALAGMAGYLYLMVPAIAWGLMSGSFNMLEGLGRGVGGGLAKNMNTASYAEDAKKLQLAQSASAATGKSLSYAEALQFQQINNGVKEGTAVGVDINQGKASIASLAEYSNTKAYKDLKKKEQFMEKLGYNGGVDNVVNAEANVSAANLTRGLGEFQTAGISGIHGAGQYAGRADTAHAAIERIHKSALTKSMFNNENENVIKTNERMHVLKKQIGNLDSYFKTSSKQDTMTQEIPNFLRNDRNGNGKISNSEMAFEEKINTIEAKKSVVNKFAQQQQELKNFEKNKHSNSSTVRNAQASAESLMTGSNSTTKEIIGAAAAKTSVSSLVDNASQRKDARVIEELHSQGKTMEGTSLLDSKRMVGDLDQTKTQTNTTGNLIKDLVSQKGQIAKQISQKVDSRKDMSWAQKAHATNKILMNDMANVGIADSKLTHKNLSYDVQKIETSTQSKLKAGLEATVGKDKLNTLNTYKSLVEDRNKLSHNLAAEKDPAKRAQMQAAIKRFDNVVMPEFEKSANVKAAKSAIEAYSNSSQAKSIINAGQQKLNATYSEYEREGLIKINKNGHIKYADTVKTINSLHGEKKALYVEGVKRSLDGLKTSTIGINGMQLERVDSITGAHVTERATATQEYSKTARFNYDIQYYAAKNNWIKPENLAKVNTGVHNIKGLFDLYGFGKTVYR